MRRDFQKSINSTWINTRVNKNRIHKVPSSNCNHRLFYLRKWHIQMESDITNSLSDNINATLSWDSVLTLSFWSVGSSLSISFWSVGSSLSIIFLICWIESVDPVADLCLINQILYRILNFIQCCWMPFNRHLFEFKRLLNSNKSLNCKILTLKCCSKMWTRGLKGW